MCRKDRSRLIFIVFELICFTFGISNVETSYWSNNKTWHHTRIVYCTLSEIQELQLDFWWCYSSAPPQQIGFMFRFCPSDMRCGIELDEIDPAKWKLLEDATDEFIIREDATFDACASLLVHNMVEASPRATNVNLLSIGISLLHSLPWKGVTWRYKPQINIRWTPR